MHTASPEQQRAARRRMAAPVLLGAALAAGCALPPPASRPAHAPEQAQASLPGERLGRGAVAVPADGGRLLTWRLLASDDARLHFMVHRDGQALTPVPQALTQWLDRVPVPAGAATPRYTVTPMLDGQAAGAPATARMLAAPYLRVALQRPADWIAADGQAVAYEANDGAPADLDGDGEYEIVLKWQPRNARDNSQPGLTAPTLIDAYRLDGTRLWRIDLGPNIRSGAHYTPFVAYDLDGDGRAELMLRTADGTVDGQGRTLGDALARHANAQGQVLQGAEGLTVFDGLSGAALASTPYLPARGDVAGWGDTYGNRADRFLAGVAYLDGQRPSAVFSRGYYTRAVIAAWDWRDGRLSPRWVADSDAGPALAPLRGQGAHWFAVSDVDGDGHDDIVYGAATVGHDGRLKYSTGLGHGDALHVGRLDPTRPGRQVFMVHENPGTYGRHGIEMHDAATGALLWSHPGGGDIGRGVCMDIDAAHPGQECWASVGPLFTAQGREIGARKPQAINFGLWWDGDLLRELLDKTVVAKWNPATARLDTVLDAAVWGAAANNGTKATPVFSADLFGDWREEVVWRTAGSDALLIATTPHATGHRLVTLMQDRQYRVQVAAQNAGYNQPPQPSFFLGEGMASARVLP